MLNATPLTGLGNPPASLKTLYGDPAQICSGVQGAITRTSFSWTAVPLGAKSTTYLFVPTGNGTLSPLPWGLKRYVGEQSFGLVVVNNPLSQSVTSASIPLPWGGTSSGITLAPGLNDFLIPRNQLIGSPIGESILLGEQIPNASTNGGSLLSGSNGGAVLNGGGQATLAQLECYWQNRAVTASPSLCGAGFSGTTRNTSYAVEVSAALNCTAGNCGGVWADPAAENASSAGAALAVLITLNLTSQTGSAAQLEDTILAGLLTNTTGGVNGTLQPITGQVGQLGFAPVIQNAIANVTYPGGGLFGLPTSHATPPAPTCSPWSGCGLVSFFNSAVSTLVEGTVLVGLLMCCAVVLYIVLGPAWMSKVGGAVRAATDAGLAYAGNWIARAEAMAVQWILSEVALLFSPVTAPMQTETAMAATQMNRSIDQAIGVNGGNFTSQGNITASAANSVAQSYATDLVEGALVLAVLFAVGVGVLTVVTPAAFATNAVDRLFIGLLVSAAGSLAITAAAEYIGVPLIYDLEGVVNGTVPQAANQNVWKATADSAGWFASGQGAASSTYTLMRTALKVGVNMALAVISFALAVLALVLTFYALVNHSFNVAILGLTVAVMSACIDAKPLLLPGNDPTSPAAQEIALATVGVDGVAFLSGLYDLET